MNTVIQTIIKHETVLTLAIGGIPLSLVGVLSLIF